MPVFKEKKHRFGLNFSDTQTAFEVKSNKDLHKAYYLFKALQNRSLVKMGTALTNFSLKLHLPVTSIIKKTVYQQFCGGEMIDDALATARSLNEYNVKTVLDYAAEASDTDFGYSNVTSRILNNIKLAKEHPEVNFISLKMTGIGSKHIFEKLNHGWQLNSHEQKEYRQIEERLNMICKAAAKANVIIYIDAEESWMQNPIDTLTEIMMQRYNKEKPIVFNTLQMYRVDRLWYCEMLINDAREKKYIAGIKIVRGAYQEKEVLRAKQKGYKNPVFVTKEDTDKSFDAAIDLCLNNLDVCALCAATHNEKSVAYLLGEIDNRNLHKHADRILFSQLYGMSDNLTFNLAKAGWHASKYLPYGEVKTAIPYLMRRAEENTSIAGQMGRELSLLKQELQRRKNLEV